VVVNLAHRLLPSADVLYAADSGFWRVYRDAQKFAGLKLAPADQRVGLFCPSVVDVDIPKDHRGTRLCKLQRGPVGTIGCGGGNSAFQAVNLAVQFGAARILLAGIDYCGAHWHADHPAGLRNPTSNQFKIWRTELDAAAPTLREWGVDVVNLSDSSTLRAYRYESADSVFAGEEPAGL
jgi:hypothetical protein